MNYSEILSGLPYYGRRVLCCASELEKVRVINGFQIYKDSGRYYFQTSDEIGKVYICFADENCDEATIQENFCNYIATLGIGKYCS